ncbi:DUF551 domain-containing protein [Pseudomonas aeruginosa]|uniref:DUF551 domain-containing protein n=1 Tax=Pseudomonas aeruginosa TaxID=287 RepID=UPI0039BD10E3
MSEWIKCSDRLPLEPDPTVIFESVRVLTSDREGNVRECEFARGGGHLGIPWACWSTYNPLRTDDITHWMPLPAPPQDA